MPEGHRLRRLQVGEARHDRAGIRERLFRERLLQVPKARIDLVNGVAHPEAEIGRHLVVPRARRVQPPRGRPDQLLQPRFDMGMDILERALELELSCFDFSQDRV